ncbi:hypothetical protein N9X05_17145 [Paracoccaceae bacterium]|nr:hypothetical protein [Paracoccaceae bacterium]
MFLLVYRRFPVLWQDHGVVSGIQCEGRIMSRSGLWWQHTVVATADSRAFI